MSRASFVYMWEHPDGRYYFGKRRGHPDDGYLTGSPLLKADILKDKLWQRTILLLTDNEPDAYKYEGKLIRKHKHDPLCLNQKQSIVSGYSHWLGCLANLVMDS